MDPFCIAETTGRQSDGLDEEDPPAADVDQTPKESHGWQPAGARRLSVILSLERNTERSDGGCTVVVHPCRLPHLVRAFPDRYARSFLRRRVQEHDQERHPRDVDSLLPVEQSRALIEGPHLGPLLLLLRKPLESSHRVSQTVRNLLGCVPPERGFWSPDELIERDQERPHSIDAAELVAALAPKLRQHHPAC